MTLLYPNFASTFYYYVRRAVSTFVQTKNVGIEFNADFVDPTSPFNATFSNPKTKTFRSDFRDPVTPIDAEFELEANTI